MPEAGTTTPAPDKTTHLAGKACNPATSNPQVNKLVARHCVLFISNDVEELILLIL